MLLHEKRKIRGLEHPYNLIESMQRQNRAVIFWIQGKANRLDVYEDK